MRTSAIIYRNLAYRFTTIQPRPYTGKSYEVVKEERKSVAPAYTHYYKEPFMPVQGHKEFLYDSQGKEYIDLIGGISCMNIGHSHPRITKIFHEQSEKLLNLSSRYTHPYQGEYAEKLCASLGNGFDTVFFFNSGSQANDFVFNLLKAHTKNNVVVSLRNGYHGTAGNAYNLTTIGSWNNPLSKGQALERLAIPNFYRTTHASVHSLIRDAEEQLDATTNGRVAGIFVEPVMGAGGIIPLEKEYIHSLYKIIKRMGGLWVADQIQTGFGRIGKEYWGHKWHDIVPDAVVMAKAINNGYPFAAVATRRQIADSLDYNYFPTFAGGPLECRMGMQVLDVIRDEKLADNAQVIGAYFLSEFKRIAAKSRFIGDVRGKGMLVAVEVVKDKETKEASSDLLNVICEQTRQHGLLIGRGGPRANLIRTLGPICLSSSSARKVVQIIQAVMQNIEKTH